MNISDKRILRASLEEYVEQYLAAYGADNANLQIVVKVIDGRVFAELVDDFKESPIAPLAIPDAMWDRIIAAVRRCKSSNKDNQLAFLAELRRRDNQEAHASDLFPENVQSYEYKSAINSINRAFKEAGFPFHVLFAKQSHTTGDANLMIVRN
jgi:hypothetical protein